MVAHHKIPRSRGGPDEDWNLEELSVYDHAYGHALDFILFDSSPWFDNRQPGWGLLPNDLRRAVRERQSERRKVEYLGESNPNYGNHSLKGIPLSPEHRQRISDSNKGKIKTEEHRQKLSKAKTGKKMSPQTPNNPNRIKGAKEGWGKRDREPNRKQWMENNPAKIRTSCLFCGKETNLPSINNFHLNCNQHGKRI